MIHVYGVQEPRIHPTAFVHDAAHVIGDVELGEDPSARICTVVTPK